MGGYVSYCVKRNRTKRHHNLRRNKVDLRAQMATAVLDLISSRGCIVSRVISWIAQESIGYKDISSRKAGKFEQGLKVVARLIAVKRDPGGVSAQAPRCLSDKHEPGINWPRCSAQYALAFVHARTSGTKPHL